MDGWMVRLSEGLGMIWFNYPGILLSLHMFVSISYGLLLLFVGVSQSSSSHS